MNSSIIKQVSDEFLNECLETFMLEESLEVSFIIRFCFVGVNSIVSVNLVRTNGQYYFG
jgi:hypothetical protein